MPTSATDGLLDSPERDPYDRERFCCEQGARAPRSGQILMTTVEEQPDRVLAALDRSNLSRAAPSARQQLLRGASRRRVEPGAVLHPEGELDPHVHLVVSGLVRMFVAAADGRTVTVRYCRSGSLIGIASLFRRSFRLPVCVEAVMRSELLDLRPETVVGLVGSCPSVAEALLAETSERIQEFVEEIPRASFTSVTERVARHVLDLASVDSSGELVARISQEELAASVGTVREVAARALRSLRDRGLVRTERSRIILLDAQRLLVGLTDAE
jgi:CRP/FNR family transcriptional regulator, cyclic AMP receptor protein